MATILLIRHGENDWVGKKLAGRLPGIHLNQRGLQQAETIAGILKNLPIKAIWSSPLDRTIETAAPLAQQLQLSVQTNLELLEIDFGDWQGKSIKQLGRTKLWKTVQHNPQEMRFPGGESFPEAQKRLISGVEAINQQYEQQDLIACFSHSDSIRLLVAHYLNMPINAFQRLAINPTSLTVIIRQEEKIHVPFINQIICPQLLDSLKPPPPKNKPQKK
jgi:probable phosphoglycerate mutase